MWGVFHSIPSVPPVSDGMHWRDTLCSTWSLCPRPLCSNVVRRRIDRQLYIRRFLQSSITTRFSRSYYCHYLTFCEMSSFSSSQPPSAFRKELSPEALARKKEKKRLSLLKLKEKKKLEREGDVSQQVASSTASANNNTRAPQGMQQTNWRTPWNLFMRSFSKLLVTID